MLTFRRRPEDDTRTLARFYLLADHLHSLDLSSQRVTDLVELMKQHGTVLDTTLTAFESSFTRSRAKSAPAMPPSPVTFRWRCNAHGIRTR